MTHSHHFLMTSMIWAHPSQVATPTTNEKQPTKPVLPLSPELFAPPKSRFGQDTKRSGCNSAAKDLMFQHCQSKCHVQPSKPSVCINLDSYTPISPPNNVKRWLNNDLFQLDQSEKAILLTPTAWLTYSIIDASQKLLLQKTPTNTGFQSITLGKLFILKCSRTNLCKFCTMAIGIGGQLVPLV